MANMVFYKGYAIEKVTPKDFIIKKGNVNAPMNGSVINGSDGEYGRNASTMKEAKARIDRKEI